jgi:hypothetical protein
VQSGHAASVMCSYDWGATHSTVLSARAGLDLEMPYGARYSAALQAGRVGSIAVIGDDAGPHAISSGGGSASVTAPYVITPYQGIAARAGLGAEVRYAQGNPPPDGDLPVTPATAFPGSLTAQFFGNATLSGPPVATGTAANISFAWPGRPPARGRGQRRGLVGALHRDHRGPRHRPL